MMIRHPWGVTVANTKPMRCHFILLRKCAGKWECLERTFWGMTFCTYKVVGNGKTPEQAYFDAYPRTFLQKLRKFLRGLLP